MKTVVNKTTDPIRVPLPRGKILHLGPRQTGQIDHNDVDHPPLQKMLEAGTIELQDASGPSAADHETARGPHELTHGHHPPSTPQTRGDR